MMNDIQKQNLVAALKLGLIDWDTFLKLYNEVSNG